MLLLLATGVTLEHWAWVRVEDPDHPQAVASSHTKRQRKLGIVLSLEDDDWIDQPIATPTGKPTPLCCVFRVCKKHAPDVAASKKDGASLTTQICNSARR